MRKHFLLAITAVSCSSQPDLSNEDKAVAIIDSLESGDTAAANVYVDGNTYIQHNLDSADGKANLLAFIPLSKQAGNTAKVVRSFSDGNFVFTHTEYHLFGPHVGLDVFRFDHGKIVEHWDNLQVTAGPNPSGHTMTDGATKVTDPGTTEANRATATAFITTVLIGHDFSKLGDYNSPNFVQHNPQIADGLAGLGAAGPILGKFNYESIFKVLAEGNFVLVMSRVKYDGQDSGVYDLFRMEGGKIAEHWDVLQAILPMSNWKNTNGKY